jgi:hypothetical protein
MRRAIEKGLRDRRRGEQKEGGERKGKEKKNPCWGRRGKEGKEREGEGRRLTTE